MANLFKSYLGALFPALSKLHQAGVTDEMWDYLGQNKECAKAVREAIKAEMNGGSSPNVEPEKYIVPVDMSLSYPEMIKAGGYDNEELAIRDITEERYPIDRSGELRYDKELFLIPPSRDGMTTPEWHAELKANGWKLERAPELFALGAKYPDLQRKYYIVAFGSSWRHPGGRLLSPGLWGGDGGRGVDESWYFPDYRWYLHDRAVVSRKSA